jgi:hypothetical protein
MITERPLRDSDQSWLANEIANDPYHSKLGMTTDAFLATPHAFSVCFEDGEGPLFVTKYTRLLKTDIQFCCQQASKRRILLGFMERFPHVASTARAQGYKRIVVNTESPSLRRWCEKHLGFVHLEDDLSKML